MECEGGLVVRGRVEIDMRQPFRSVKEAISLFGEKVLAGEIYATTKLNETQRKVDKEQKKVISHDQGVTKEINAEVTKERINKTNEDEGNLMAFYLNSLKQELEETKKELQFLKTKEKVDELELNPEIEELKFVENSTTKLVEVKKTQTEDQEQEFQLEKKRSVKFASSPLLTRMLVSSKDIDAAAADETEDMQNNADFSSPLFEKKKRRKPSMIPLFGGLFSKKKGAQKSKSKSFRG